ncbi:MAG: RNA-directed DNA polymerase [Vampirovibrionales bacterium]|nr:RNA-directed DNA polymerase [Vampirovibrionales bacterium]
MVTKAPASKAVKETSPPKEIGIPSYKRLELAVKQILDKENQKRHDFLPDPFLYLQERVQFEEFLGDSTPNSLKNILNFLGIYDFKSYFPEKHEIIDIPKQDLGVRPGYIVNFNDKVIYQAVISSISKKISETLSPDNIVYGYKVKNENAIRPIEDGIEAWKKFHANAIHHYKKLKYKYMLKTDVVGYFEHIKHEVLFEELANNEVKIASINLLRKFLGRWSECKGSGIPQGIMGSYLLANIYLDPVDKAMIRQGFVYSRYMDDMYIFAMSESEIKQAKIFLVQNLRKIGLSLQSKKTDIFRGRQILSHLEEKFEGFEYIKKLQKAKGIPEEIVIKKIKKEIKLFTSSGGENSKHLKFFLWRIKSIKNKNAFRGFVLSIFRNLDKYNYLSDVIAEALVDYIQWPSARREVFTYVFSDKAIFEWQNYWLLKMILSFKGVLERDYLNKIRQALAGNSHFKKYDRCLLYLILGKNGDINDFKYIMDNFSKESNLYVQKAILLSLKKSHKVMRNNFYSGVGRIRPELEGFIRLIKASNADFLGL